MQLYSVDRDKSSILLLDRAVGDFCMLGKPIESRWSTTYSVYILFCVVYLGGLHS